MASSLNMVTVLRENLEFKVKQTLTESLVKQHLAEYEKELRGVIQNLMNEVSFSHIEQINNHLEQRQEYQLWIKWNDEIKQKVES